MRSRFDSIWIGFGIGILVPVLSILMFYSTNFTRVSLPFFLEHTASIEVLPKLISVCAVPNLGVFFLFLWRNHYFSGRGVIMATFLLTFAVLALILLF